MPQNQKIKPENLERIKELYKQGKSSAEIGKEFNVSHMTILKYLKKNKIPVRKRGWRNKFNLEKLLNVWDTTEGKKTYKKLAKNAGISVCTLRKYIYSDERLTKMRKKSKSRRNISNIKFS